MKPICCGNREDAERLLGASSDGVSIDELNPVWLKTPAAPLAASLIEQVEIDTNLLLRGFAELKRRFDVVIVEGVGGWMVPIRQDYFVSDLAVAMQLPVIVVVPNRLGCLNHAILTIRSIESHGARCAGIVFNRAPVADIASSTNQDLLLRTTTIPQLTPLDERTGELPADWRSLLSSNRGAASVERTT